MEVDCVPISALPGVSKLLIDYLSHSPKARSYYAPHDGHVPIASDYPQARREQVADILKKQNSKWNASEATLRNIERLRAGAAAVVTGQQVTLFGGPLFAIYKALTTIRLAEEQTKKGQDAVPVFWLATTDHDLAEVDHIQLLSKERQLLTVKASGQGMDNAPLANVRLKDVEDVLSQLASLYDESEVLGQIQASYRTGIGFGDAFATFFVALFADFGLILLDPYDRKLQQIAQSLYAKVLERTTELNQSLLERGRELESDGYHVQVKVTESSTLLFKTQDGKRTPIHRGNDASDFRVGEGKTSVTELRNQIETNPEQFTGNVLLRPVIQDFLLPTATYIAGPTEIAYFAQAAVIYESLLGRITPLVLRFSATLIEPGIRNWLHRYQLSVKDALVSHNELARHLGSVALPNTVQARFASAEATIANELATLERSLHELDPSIGAAAQTSISKIKYQLEKLRTRAANAELRKNNEVTRHAVAISNSLFPQGELQERGIAAVSFLAKYGNGLLRRIYDSFNPLAQQHHILYL